MKSDRSKEIKQTKVDLDQIEQMNMRPRLRKNIGKKFINEQ